MMRQLKTDNGGNMRARKFHFLELACNLELFKFAFFCVVIFLDEKDWRAIPRFGMWVDNSADYAVVFGSYKGHRATRTDEVFEDPVDKRLKTS